MKEIPTTKEIQKNIENDIIQTYDFSDDLLKKNYLAMSGVFAAQIKSLYLFLSDIQNNIFVTTADTESEGGTLNRIGEIYLNRDMKPATIGLFKAVIEGEIGTVLPEGLTFKSNENTKNPGQIFIIDKVTEITSSNMVINIRSSGAGAIYDLNVNDVLTLTQPVIGASDTIKITSVTDQPKESENVEDYRQLILDNIRLEPQGGARTDYMLWAKDAQGVRRVYPYVKIGDAGTVEVYIEATKADSSDGNGTPTDAIKEDVKEVINFDPDISKPKFSRGRLPAQVNLHVKSVIVMPVNIEISGMNDLTPDVKYSIENNIGNYVYSVRPYIAGGDLPRDKNDVIYLAKIQSIVTNSISNDNYYDSIDMEINGISVNKFKFDKGVIPYVNTITYV